MRRALAYFVAFTGMGSLFMGTLILAAVVLGVTPTGTVTVPAALVWASAASRVPFSKVRSWAMPPSLTKVTE